MKLGLCLTFCKGVNYGMQLQALATQRMFENLGYETEIIDYKRINYKGIRLTPYLFVSLLNQKIKNLNKNKHNIPQEFVDIRKLKAKDFVEKYFHNIVSCRGFDSLRKIALSYDAIIVGSDQLWGPDAVFGNFYTLRFVPDSINKISYATSMGVLKYPYYARSSAKQFLNRINYISVREQQAGTYLSSLVKRQISVVLDPTYMLTEEEWLNIIPYQKNGFGDYILCYFLGDKVIHKKLSREFADKKQLKLVSILSTESEYSFDDKYADYVVSSAGPDEFVNLIRNAKYVLTDSFHGIAFSVISRKQFYAFYRTNSKDKDSRNSRIDNIISLWNLGNRLIKDDSSLDAFSTPDIKYDELKMMIDQKKEESYDFITRALCNG